MKKIIIPAAAILLIGLCIGYYQYNKPHKNIVKAKTEYKMEAAELFRAYQADELAADHMFLDRIIEVSGEINKVSNDGGHISLSLKSDDDFFGIICNLDEHSTHFRNAFEPGENITLKGICTGSLMDVVLVRCIEVKS